VVYGCLVAKKLKLFSFKSFSLFLSDKITIETGFPG